MVDQVWATRPPRGNRNPHIDKLREVASIATAPIPRPRRSSNLKLPLPSPKLPPTRTRVLFSSRPIKLRVLIVSPLHNLARKGTIRIPPSCKEPAAVLGFATGITDSIARVGPRAVACIMDDAFEFIIIGNMWRSHREGSRWIFLKCMVIFAWDSKEISLLVTRQRIRASGSAGPRLIREKTKSTLVPRNRRSELSRERDRFIAAPCFSERTSMRCHCCLFSRHCLWGRQNREDSR